MSVVNDTRDRIMALCELIDLPGDLGTGIAYEAEEECGYGTLPAYIVVDAPDEGYARMDVSTYQTQQEFIILVYISVICDESYRENVPAWDLVKDCRETISDYFMQRPTLAMDDAGIVDYAMLSRGRKMTLESSGSDSKYHGLTFRLATAFTRRVGQTDYD